MAAFASSFANKLLGEVIKKAEKYFKKGDDKERTRSIIVEDVYLYTTRTKEPLSFVYEIGSSSTKTVRVTLDFSGSVNFTASDAANVEQNLRLSMVVVPFSRKVIGSMRQGDPRQASRLAVDYIWELIEVDKEQIKASADVHMSRITTALENQAAAPEGGSGHFIDTDFPPCKDSLYVTNRDAGEGDSEAQEIDPNEIIVWNRPGEFMGGNYDVFIGGIEPSDICQGSLGDCWFLCSLACLGEFPEYVEYLFSADSRKANPNGRYEIKFCHYGDWKTVVVDDYFPCYPDGGPVYARGHDNELWVLLLEKAYAKMCGSYAALKSGWAYEAMIDLTGAPYSTVRFEDEKTASMILDGSLWQLLKSYDEMGYIQSASTPGEDTLTVGGERRAKDDATGLVAGHAYAILRIKETFSGIRLLEIRNPWGQGGMEWNGDWSDKSSLWTEALKMEIDARIQEDDGAFWMSFSDFLENFYSVNVCMVRQPETSGEEQKRTPWFETRERFTYSMHDGDGGKEVSCPSYLLSLSQKSEHVFVSVHQKDTRCVGSGPYIDIGVTVLQITSETKSGFKLIASTGNSSDRQNQTDAMSLEAGEYLILPTSTGCKLRRTHTQTTAATVVVHSSKPHTVSEKPHNQVAYEEAMELPIVKFGTAKILEPSKITLYTRRSGFSGMSYLIKNDHDRPLRFTQDCSVGKNIISHRGTLVHEQTIMPGHCEVLHHIMPDNNQKGWQSGFSASYDWM